MSTAAYRSQDQGVAVSKRVRHRAAQQSVCAQPLSGCDCRISGARICALTGSVSASSTLDLTLALEATLYYLVY